ncbi:MAG TPA: RNA polymerase sigma factor RpoH [Burkholderiales bacterium]|nr:RNA polymerase sigma factor RpoH [Burkholderiales bacterium]
MTALNLPVPVASSLESYIASVHSIPMLSAEREMELGKRLKYESDLDAARELVLSHLRLVVSVARNYLGYGLPHADLIQEGNIGLMKAVKRFDPDRGVRLVSFAVHWIKAEIHEFILKNWRMVKIATTKSQRKLFFNLRSMKTSLNTLSANEVKDMANTLGVKPEEVVEMETRLQGQDIPLQAQTDDNEDWVSPIAYLTDPEAEPSRLLEAKQSEKHGAGGLEAALHFLDPRSRRIIEARWLQDDGGATLHDLADEFGVSAERIRQIEVKAMQKLRGALNPES